MMGDGSFGRFINDWMVFYALVVIWMVILGHETSHLALFGRLLACLIGVTIQRILYFLVYVPRLRTPIHKWLEARANG